MVLVGFGDDPHLVPVIQPGMQGDRAVIAVEESVFGAESHILMNTESQIQDCTARLQHFQGAVCQIYMDLFVESGGRLNPVRDRRPAHAFVLAAVDGTVDPVLILLLVLQEQPVADTAAVLQKVEGDSGQGVLAAADDGQVDPPGQKAFVRGNHGPVEVRIPVKENVLRILFLCYKIDIVKGYFFFGNAGRKLHKDVGDPGAQVMVDAGDIAPGKGTVQNMPFPFTGLLLRPVTGPERIRIYRRSFVCLARIGKIDVGQDPLHIIDRAAVLRKQFLIALFDNPEALTVSQMQAHFLQDLDLGIREDGGDQGPASCSRGIRTTSVCSIFLMTLW